jgi:hypothetical protein
MIRVLSILAAVAALAVSAAPVASAGPSKAKVPPPSVRNFNPADSGANVGSDHAWANYPSKAVKPKPRGLDIGTAERLDMNAVANHTESTVRGISAGRYGDGRFAGVKDGSSKTLMVGE